MQQQSEGETPPPVRHLAIAAGTAGVGSVTGEAVGCRAATPRSAGLCPVAGIGAGLQAGMGGACAAYEGQLKEYIKTQLIPDLILGGAQGIPGGIHELSPENRSNIIDRLVKENGVNRNTAARLVDEAASVPSPADSPPSPKSDAMIGTVREQQAAAANARRGPRRLLADPETATGAANMQRLSPTRM